MLNLAQPYTAPASGAPTPPGAPPGANAPGGYNPAGNAYSQSQSNAAALAAAKAKLDATTQSEQSNGMAGLGPDMSALAAYNQVASGVNNPRGQYGGYTGGANDFAGSMASLGQQYQGRNAPNIGMQNPYGDADRANILGSIAAEGRAPGVAQAQFGQNLNASIQAQQAAANSARGGGAALASAQRGAGQQAAQMQAQGAQQSAIIAGQESLQSAAQQAQGYGAIQGLDAQQAAAQAGLYQNQDQINQQGQLGALGLANSAETAQLEGDANAYGQNLNYNANEDAIAAGSKNALISGGTAAFGAGLGALAAFG